MGEKRGKSNKNNKNDEMISGDIHLLFNYKALAKNEQKEEEKKGIFIIFIFRFFLLFQKNGKFIFE